MSMWLLNIGLARGPDGNSKYFRHAFCRSARGTNPVAKCRRIRTNLGEKPKMHSWTAPLSLKDYLKAEKSPGLYVIGSATSPGLAPTPSNESNDYLLHNFPENFRPEYVGISESTKTGVKARLSKHARARGSKHIAQLLKQRVDLYFIVIYGNVLVTRFEPLFTALKAQGQFEGNVRLEHLRDHAKRHEQIHEAMTGEKLAKDLPWDFEGDGM